MRYFLKWDNMSDDKNRNNHSSKKSPYDFFSNEEELKRIFSTVEQLMEKAIREMAEADLEPEETYIRGFNVHTNEEGKPKVEEFGNDPRNISKGKIGIHEKREPLSDIIENKNDVAITIELPGVEKEDIELDVKQKQIKIRVNHPARKYKTKINLPCEIRPKTTMATYKNGILDIVMKKSEDNNEKFSPEIR